jgi:hypothetical protein
VLSPVIVIPTYGRPQRVAPLVANLKAVTPWDYRLLFVVEEDDEETQAAAVRVGAEFLINRGERTYAACINQAFYSTEEPYLFAGADDIEFRAGWLESALACMDDQSVGVVGCYDPSHPFFDHAAHYLVRRSYIESWGGCLDRRDVVLCPDYGHGCTDLEMVGVAKARGSYRFCPESVVVHRHPGWNDSGKVIDSSPLFDSTYLKGNESMDRDRKLLLARAPMWLKQIEKVSPADRALASEVRWGRLAPMLYSYRRLKALLKSIWAYRPPAGIIYTVSARPWWASFAERLPMTGWDALRQWRWSLLGRVARPWVRRAAARIHWVFIVGCSNSGTTLLAHVLSRHPDICALPYEGHFMTSALPRPWAPGSRVFSERLDLFRLTEEDRVSELDEVLFDWLIASLFRGRRPVVLVKSPNDMLRTRWLQAGLPRCSFIGLVRNGYAVCEGIRRREGYELARCARHWAKAHEVLLSDQERIRRMHLLRYEDLCANPTATLTELASFLGLAPEPLEEAESVHWEVHNLHQTAGPLRDLNSDSISRLSLAERDLVRAEAGPMLERFGYIADALA